MTKHGAEWHGASDGMDPFERSKADKMLARARAAHASMARCFGVDPEDYGYIEQALGRGDAMVLVRAKPKPDRRGFWASLFGWRSKR